VNLEKRGNFSRIVPLLGEPSMSLDVEVLLACGAAGSAREKLISVTLHVVKFIKKGKFNL
jgi:hypothetical protein